MTILLMEGFEGLNTGADDLYKLGFTVSSSTYNIISTRAKTGTRSLRTRRLSSVTVPLGENISSADYIVIGCHIYQTGLADDSIIAIGSYNKIYQDDSTGELLVEYGNNSGNSTGAFLSLDTWHYLKFKFRLNSTNGIFQIWLDGALVYDLENVDTVYSGTTFNKVSFGGGYYGYFDNIFIAKNEFPSDELFIDTLLPNANGNHTDFTPSAGSNYECVDDPLDETDYVESSTVGHKDSYEFTSLHGSVGTIHAVQTSLSCTKNGLGTRSIKPITRIGSTDYEGDEIFLPLGSNIEVFVWDQSPATSSAWTVTEVDGAEFGVKQEI